MSGAWRRSTVLALAPLALAVSACGSDVKLPEAPHTSPLKASTVPITQTGSGLATIDPSSITYSLDAAGSLVVKLSLTSTAAGTQTFAIRGSLYNDEGSIIDDVTGGSVNVAPGSTTRVVLNGIPPDGTISSARYEVTGTAAPTPTLSPG